MRIPNKPFTLTMGPTVSPEYQDGEKTQVIRRSCDGAEAVILKQDGQLALVAYTAWESVETKERRGVNPAAENNIWLVESCAEKNVWVRALCDDQRRFKQD